MVNKSLSERMAEAGIQPLDSSLFPLSGDDAGLVFEAMSRLSGSEEPLSTYQELCGLPLPNWDGSFDGLSYALDRAPQIDDDAYHHWLYRIFVAPFLLMDRSTLQLKRKYGARLAQIQAENEAIKRGRKDDINGTNH